MFIEKLKFLGVVSSCLCICCFLTSCSSATNLSGGEETQYVEDGKGQSISAANAALGRGLNLGNFLEPPRDANWRVEIQVDHLQLIKDAGFDSIRLPVRWPDYASKKPPFTIEPAFFQQVDDLLDAAEAAKLNVVLNIHHFEGLDNEPEKYREQFKTLWRQIASHYRNRGKFLYFELNNEPHLALNDHWNEILLEGLAAVRQSNPIRPVIIGPPHWNGIWALPQLELPADPNLIVTVHMYNPHEFTHQGASWAEPEIRSIKDMSWGTDEEISKVEREIAEAAKWGLDHQRPIYLGEFGAYEAAPLESRIAWTRCVAQAAEKHKMSWAYWEFAAGFGLFDLSTRQWRPILEALPLAH